jgi:hypothetical protein
VFGVEDERSTLDGAVVFVAMELSKSAWLLAAQGSPSGKTSSHRLESGDIASLLTLLRRLQARERQACGAGDVQLVVGHEAGYDGFWLQRCLAADGITCWVMDPGSLQVNRRARRAKTDRLDAAMLLRALIAWCRGDRAACHMVQVPSVAREDARRTHRERQRLWPSGCSTSTGSRVCSRRRGSMTTSRCGVTARHAWRNCAQGMVMSCRHGYGGKSTASSSGWNSCSSSSKSSRPSGTRLWPSPPQTMPTQRR